MHVIFKYLLKIFGVSLCVELCAVTQLSLDTFKMVNDS